MHALPGAATLCRVLVGLDRAGASGALHLRASGRGAIITLHEGHMVGASIDRLVVGSTQQLIACMWKACHWDDVAFRFDREAGLAEHWMLDEHVRACAPALSIMRAAAARVNPERIRVELGDALFRLTEAGEALVDRADLGPAEQTAVLWLRRGVLPEDIAGLPGCGLRGYRFVWVLKMLGAAAPKRGGSCPLLLRKRMELRRRSTDYALLDLPEDADSREARAALRRLVRHLHPDRFGEGVTPALRRASGEIVTALVDAEARIASRVSD
jgi:hypothetical protein